MRYSQLELIEEGIWDKFIKPMTKGAFEVAKFAGQTLDPNTYNILAGAANKTKEGFKNVRRAVQTPEDYISKVFKDRGMRVIDKPKKSGENYIVNFKRITFDDAGKPVPYDKIRLERMVVDKEGNKVGTTQATPVTSTTLSSPTSSRTLTVNKSTTTP